MRTFSPLLLVALAAASAAPAAAKPEFTAGSFTAAALETSPEVRSSYQAFAAADAAYKSQLAAAALPTLSFTGSDNPYGYNPSNGSLFQHWRLNRHDMTFTTGVDLNVFNSFQDYQRTRATRLSLESAERAYWAARQDRALAAVTAFYDLDAKLKLLEVARQNLAAQQDQYDQSKELYRNGMKSLADLLKSETDFQSSQLRLLDAEAEEKRSRVTFNTLLDREGLAPASLAGELTPGTTVLPSLERDLAGALQARPEVVRARKELERAVVAVQQAAQQLIPSLRADAHWSRTEQATFGNPAFTGSNPDPSYYFSLALSLPFGFNIVSQTYNLVQAKAQKRQAEQTLASALRQARTEVYGAYISLEHDIAAYSFALQKEDISRQTLDLVSAQYNEGTADAIRMNQAQTDYLDAQVSRTLALHAIFTDRAQYKRAVGEQLW